MNKRVTQALHIIEKDNLDAFLFSNPLNITYLTGFREAEGYLLINRSKIIYFTNFIYAQEASKIKIWRPKIINSNVFKEIIKTIKKLRIKRIGFEEKHLSYLEYKKFKEYALREHIIFLPKDSPAEKMRMVKTKKEINLIKKAIHITKDALLFAKEIKDHYAREKDLQTEIIRFFHLKSNTSLSFNPIVAFNRNSSFVHHIPTEEYSKSNKIVLIDLGARYYGYCADLTRVFFSGKMPLSLRRIFDIVRKAQHLAINKIKEGVKAKEVDRAARAFIDKKGFGKYFGHGLGHGIGLSVHEEPFINSRNSTILKNGMVITIEPAIYLPGKFGIRVEDMVLVKKNKAEILSGYINW